MVGKPLTDRQRARIARAVDRAENECGLQVLVYVGPAEGDARAAAEAMLADAGVVDSEAVLLLVDPVHRHYEIVPTPAARRRLSDRACALAGVAMAASFGVGDIAGGVREGIRLLAQLAGPGEEDPTRELPDLLGP